MRRCLLALPLVALASPAAAQRGRVVVQPYVEAVQTVDADLKGDDVVTYSTLAAGVDVSADTARTSAQLSYRYERRFGWDDDGDGDVHSGLARVAARVTPALTLEAGALAARARSDIRGAAPGFLTSDDANISQVYALYAGPTLATQTGDVTFNALYRIGYTKVETPGAGGLAPGLGRLDYYDDSLGQQAFASVGTAPRSGVLPVALTVSGGWEREDAGQLSQRYEGWFGRGDVLAPVSPYVALTAGVGYERIETSQRAALLGAGGVPVLDEDGRFVEDPNSPRRIAYRTDGVYYDAGVVWRPNRRTHVEGHVGKRYGSVSYTGSVTYQASANVGLAIGVYDTVTTFGRQLRNGLTGLPTSFITARDASFSQQYNGCIFGTQATQPGGCLSDVFQSINTSSYRARGVDGVLTAVRGLNTFGIGAGYASRKLYAPRNLPAGIVVYGLEDESYYAQAFWARTLSPVSSVSANAFANYYTSELQGSEDVYSLGVTGSYFHSFGRLGTTASVGLYSFKVGDFDSSLTASAQLAARYTF